MDNKSQDPGKNNKPGGSKKPRIWVTLIITAVILLLISVIYNAVVNSMFEKTTFSEFMDVVEKDQLAEVEFRFDRLYYLTKEEAAKPEKEQTFCFTGLPSGDLLAFSAELDAKGVDVDQLIQEDNSFIIMILMYAVMFGLIFLFMRMLTKRMSGEGMMGGFGKKGRMRFPF